MKKKAIISVLAFALVLCIGGVLLPKGPALLENGSDDIADSVPAGAPGELMIPDTGTPMADAPTESAEVADVLNLVNEQIGGLSGNVKQKFFPRISVTFTFSLFRNPQGMIPFSFTVTSHFLITLALSFSIFIGITIVGFQRHGLHFFSFLLPAGVPLPLAPFLVLLELISYCFRALSLGIRLFANMMAGHSLVKILSGFAWTMLFLNNIFYFIGDLGPLFIVLALTGLELGVAISQAHVSTISICIYLNDATNLHQNESFHN